MNPKALHLPFWSEFVGVFKGPYKDQNYTYIKMKEGSLLFRNESNETTYVREKLNNNIIGRKIAILRTDVPGEPLLIRLVGR